MPIESLANLCSAHARLNGCASESLSSEDQHTLEYLERFLELITFCNQQPTMPTVTVLPTLLARKNLAFNDTIPLVQEQYLAWMLLGVTPTYFFALGRTYFDSPAQFTGFLCYLLRNGIPPAKIEESGLLTHYIMHRFFIDATEESFDFTSLPGITFVHNYFKKPNPSLALRLETITHLVNTQALDEAIETSYFTRQIEPIFKTGNYSSDKVCTLYTIFKDRLIPYLDFTKEAHQTALQNLLKSDEKRNILQAIQPYFYLPETDIFPLQSILYSSLESKEIEVLLREETTHPSPSEEDFIHYPYLFLFLLLPPEKQALFENQHLAIVRLFFSAAQALHHSVLEKLFPVSPHVSLKRKILHALLENKRFSDSSKSPQAHFINTLYLTDITTEIKEREKALDNAICQNLDFSEICELWEKSYRSICFLKLTVNLSNISYPNNMYALTSKMILHALETNQDLTALLARIYPHGARKDQWQKQARAAFSAWLHLIAKLTLKQNKTLGTFTLTICVNKNEWGDCSLYPTMDDMSSYIIVIRNLIKHDHLALLEIALTAELDNGTPALNLFDTKNISDYAHLLQYLIDKNQTHALTVALSAQHTSGTPTLHLFAEISPKDCADLIISLVENKLVDPLEIMFKATTSVYPILCILAENRESFAILKRLSEKMAALSPLFNAMPKFCNQVETLPLPRDLDEIFAAFESAFLLRPETQPHLFFQTKIERSSAIRYCQAPLPPAL